MLEMAKPVYISVHVPGNSHSATIHAGKFVHCFFKSYNFSQNNFVPIIRVRAVGADLSLIDVTYKLIC
jgi:hypothetical protein